jgi:magnesium transporter
VARGTLGPVITVRVYRDGVADKGTIEPSAIAECLAKDDAFVWFDASEPTDADIAALGEAFGLHPLTLEDIGHRRQRPRVELFEHYAFITLRPLSLRGDDLTEHEVHAVAGGRFLGTLRYGPDPFPIDEVVKRWERQPDLLKSDPGAFAVYVLFDEVVDGYLTIVEELEDRADDLEDLVFADDPTVAGTEIQERIFLVKREVVTVRRFASPMRQGLDLLQEQPDLVKAPLLPYYRDVTEHAIRVFELADNIRDVLTSLLELRVAQVANHLNDVMKKLTAWAGILLVPTLIAGIYGMNFRNMPELGWRYGYAGALLVMGGSALALYIMFKKKDWL